MYAYFNRFTIKMTLEQAKSVSHQGQCDEDVKKLLKVKEIARQINKLDIVIIREELKEYGAWSDMELVDTESNNQRIVWIAGCQIMEDYKEKIK